MTTKNHWDDVYGRKRADEVSWFRPHLDISLDFIRTAALPHDARIVDVGGGASTLVDDLLALGYTNLAVADIAESAIEVSRERLGSRAKDVDWIVGDITSSLIPPSSVDFWHDRAVFHFLVNENTRAAYISQVARSVKGGGRVMV
ncbi:MAG: SAM-dependent methyltransferase, partial [Myxococcota bacterium]